LLLLPPLLLLLLLLLQLCAKVCAQAPFVSLICTPLHHLMSDSGLCRRWTTDAARTNQGQQGPSCTQQGHKEDQSTCSESSMLHAGSPSQHHIAVSVMLFAHALHRLFDHYSVVPDCNSV